MKTITKKPKNKISSLKKILKGQTLFIVLLIIITVLVNGLTILLPTLIGNILDEYKKTQNLDYSKTIWTLGLIITFSLLFGFCAQYLSTLISEKIGANLRDRLISKLSKQSQSYIANITPAKLLTIITSDVNQVKQSIPGSFIAFFTAVFTLIGSGIFLIILNLKLALISLSVIPFIGITFFVIFSQVTKLFKARQTNTDKSNLVVEENIAGASTIRVLNSQNFELVKYQKINQEAKRINSNIVRLFAGFLNPTIALLANIAIALIVWFGGRDVINKTLSLGQFSAFFSYLSLMITPVYILGFVSTDIARSFISLDRIQKVLQAKINQKQGQIKHIIKGFVEFKNVSLKINGIEILKNITFEILPNTKTAIIGPTASGKTQLFFLMTGLTKPTSGEILIDGKTIDKYDPKSLFSQMGLVFQESIIFNTSLKENIAFQENITPDNYQKAVETSSLNSFIKSLKNAEKTNISERGTNLSGGQKQRIMLARALAINPKILLLDDFTARVDVRTEKEIIQKLQKNYPNISLISITQKIEPVQNYDQIVLVMRGEIVAKGTHQNLLEHSFDYQKIWDSEQKIQT